MSCRLRGDAHHECGGGGGGRWGGGGGVGLELS